MRSSRRYVWVVYQNQFFGKIADAITGALDQAMLTGDKTEKQSQLKIGQLRDNVLQAQVVHLSTLWTFQPHFARQVRNDEWRGIAGIKTRRDAELMPCGLIVWVSLFPNRV